MFEVTSPSDDEVYYRNLYKAGQRRVSDLKRKHKERVALYNRRFHQLELPLISSPDSRKWLESKLNSKKRTYWQFHQIIDLFQ